MILLALRSKDALTLMLHHVIKSPSELRDGVAFVGTTLTNVTCGVVTVSLVHSSVTDFYIVLTNSVIMVSCMFIACILPLSLHECPLELLLQRS